MVNNQNLSESESEVNTKFERDMQLAKIRKELLESYENYNKVISQMGMDAPIEVLCLPQAINKILLREGCRRIPEVLKLDLTKVKGLGVTRQWELTTSLNQFLSML